LLLWLTDAIIVALVVVFPFIMGGREAWGHRTLITLSLALGFVWCLHRVRTGGRLLLLSIEPLLIAGLLLVWLQTIPLTSTVLGQLSKEYERLLPFWAETQIPADGQAGPSQWSTASFYPSETQHALLMLLSYSVIAVVMAQRLSTEEDCHNLLKLIGISGVSMAAFAVLQLVTSNDRFFWFYQQPYTGTKEILKGAFTNRNHFAQFLTLSIGPLIWWTLVGRLTPEAQRPLHRRGLGPAHGNHSRFGNLIDVKLLMLMCAVGGVLLSVMLSLSRGGMLAAGLACIVCLAGLWKSGRVKGSVAMVMVGLSVIVIAGLVVFGHDKVEDRVDQLASVDADKIDRLNARRTIWKADIKAIRAFPVMGTGVGSHRHVYPIYMEELADFADISFSHAESSYIHLALETGLAGLGLLSLGLLFLLGRILWHFFRRQEPERVAALAAVLAGLAGGVTHAAADFIWYVPAIVVLTIMLGVAGLRLCSGFRPEQGLYMPRIGWLVAGLVCLLILCQSQPDLGRRVAGERLWFQYLISSFAERREGDEASLNDVKEPRREAVTPVTKSRESNSIASYEDEEESEQEAVSSAAGRASNRGDSLRARVNLLIASLKANPNQADVALHLASKSLELFELLQKEGDNPLPLLQIRDAVLASRFSSTTAMDAFLKRAFGAPVRLLWLSDQMSRRSLGMCPLQAEAYEMLISTGFLRDPADRRHQHMMAQALHLGRNNPGTRFAVGMALLLDGRQQEALKQWAIVFHANRRMRRSICSILARKVTVDVVLTQFAPSVDEMQEVLTSYQAHQRKPDLERILYVIAQKTQQPEPASTDSATPGRERHLPLLMTANRVAWELGLKDKCEELLQIAIDCDPNAESPRRAMGLLLFEQEKYDEAESHFAWCSEQLPGDTKLDELRQECRRLARSQPTRARSASFRRD
jgi:tetratricopeptide (TPR) repeat protein